MAMTKCRECGQPISTEATACPHCGCNPKKDNLGCAQVFVIGFLAIVVTTVTISLFGKSSPPARTATPQEEQQLREEVGALMYVRDRMKNPASFELVSFVRTDSDTFCITYRGTNSFNAITTQRYTLNNSVSSGSDSAWMEHCNGRGGKDVSKARYGLP
jgi:hypothetical protein